MRAFDFLKWGRFNLNRLNRSILFEFPLQLLSKRMSVDGFVCYTVFIFGLKRGYRWIHPQTSTQKIFHKSFYWVSRFKSKV